MPKKLAAEPFKAAANAVRVSTGKAPAAEAATANATATFHLEPVSGGSKVLVHTNLTLSGSVAQYGRGVGIIQATATQLMNQFAKCLKDKLGQEQPVAAAPTTASAARSCEPSTTRTAARSWTVRAAGRPTVGTALRKILFHRAGKGGGRGALGGALRRVRNFCSAT